jgi:hypothetical protein
VTTEQVRTTVNVSASLDRHVEWLGGYADLGFDELYLHFVGQVQAPFIDTFASHVLPQLRTPGDSTPAVPQLAEAGAEPASDASA